MKYFCVFGVVMGLMCGVIGYVMGTDSSNATSVSSASIKTVAYEAPDFDEDFSLTDFEALSLAEIETEAQTSKRMNVYTTADCTGNASVGYDWSYTMYVNGSEIYDGESITVKQGDIIEVSAKVVEDDSIPDVGTNSSSKTVTASDITNGFSISFNVTVRENRGRYSGNTANWDITFSFE